MPGTRRGSRGSSRRGVIAGRARPAQEEAALEETLRRARAVVPACDAAGVVLVRDGVPATGVGTSDTARRLDQAQCESGRGPGLEAIRQLQVFNVGSLASSFSSWPDFSATASRLGVASSLSVPLTRSGRALGVLGLYSATPDAFSGCEAAGLALAQDVALAVGPALTGEQPHRRRRSSGSDGPAVLPGSRSPFGPARPVAGEAAL